VAALVLETEATQGNPKRRDAALSQLALAGTEATPILERIGHRDGATVARARALEMLAQHGDTDAKDMLLGMLDSRDPEILASALSVADPRSEGPRLIAALENPVAAVRSAAARALGNAAPDPAARLALATAARVDPTPSVRATAVRALGRFGTDAVEVLRDRLSDADSSVRLAAVGALVQADRDRALAIIGPLLEMEPHSAAIEAARVLAEPPAAPPRAADDDESAGAHRQGPANYSGTTDARAYLLRALVTTDAGLRAQAAVALLSLPPDPSIERALLDAMAEERDAQVKLVLATALHRRASPRQRASRVLERLMGEGGMPAVQAAIVLGSAGSRKALRHLAQTMRNGAVQERRVAARALARDTMHPDAARHALRDRDPVVRISAAGGILAAVSAG